MIYDNIEELREAHRVKGDLLWAENEFFTLLIAKDGNVECLKYAHENGCSWDHLTCTYAAFHGHLDCLKYAHEHGCPWTTSTSFAAGQNAAHTNNMECLRYVHEHGCPWDELVASTLAGKGNLEALKYVHEHGCPWSEWACIMAVESGRLECLRYLHEQGCPWSEKTTYEAVDNGAYDCLVYAHEHGCSWDISHLKRVAKERREEVRNKSNFDKIIIYLHQHDGEPCSLCTFLKEGNIHQITRFPPSLWYHPLAMKYLKAATKIKRKFVKCYWDPEYVICKKRLERTFKELIEATIQ